MMVMVKKPMRKLVFLSKAAEMFTAAPELGHPAHDTNMVEIMRERKISAAHDDDGDDDDHYDDDDDDDHLLTWH